MKLFKDGIDVKWLLFVLGLVVVIGLSVATVNPIVSDTNSYLDTLYANYLHGDCSNCTGINAGVNNTTTNTWTQRQTFNGGITTVKVNATDTSVINGVNFSGGLVPTAGGTGGIATVGSNTFRIYAAAGTDVSAFAVLSNDNSKNMFTLNNTGAAIVSWLSQTQGTDDILCRDSSTKEWTYNSGSATTCAASSEEYKHSINTINSSDDIFKVRPVNFIYNDDKTNRVRMGFIAEEFCAVYPEACYTNYQGNGTFVKVVVDKTTGKAKGFLYSDGTLTPVKGIDYAYFTAMLTKRVQDQQFVLETQAAQIRNICTNNPQLCS